MKFEISRSARRQIEELNEWWVEHRPAARSLFVDELDRVERLLRDNPEVGVIYARHRRGDIRTVLFTRTAHRLYYRYRPARAELLVMSVRGPGRGQGPKF